MKCPSCAGELLPSQRFCPSCGVAVGSASQIPTGMVSPPQPAGAQSPAMVSPVGRLISSDSIAVGGFTPGMILADRYRIIGLLGRGGMGEVYRADDLKLGQPVALKFLPKELADDPVRRERFYAEVRIARQISHPNICRVYDIGELDGRHFLTMEFIDGEDLASLLKRIGHLHGAKALDVARQLCAGLAAAHDKGVLHRDLKPANVMLDGRGRVRVTDFGLAVAAGEELPAGEISGTPAYMAPEQLTGQAASVRSDIYALGLVLYEIYTGTRAFVAASLAELRSKKETTSAIAPSEVVRDMDPVVERVILRCLERDPRQRPASVAHVAAALPGGDPLAAALAAGETPSPEMVAASAGTEGLRPWVAWLCLALVVLGTATVVLLGRNAFLFQLVAMDKPPDYLAERAREILRKAGYNDLPADSAHGFTSNTELLQHVQTHDQSPSRWDRLPDSALMFWYRQSANPLQHWTSFGAVTASDPPFQGPGSSRVTLDGRGLLLGLRVIPPTEKRSPEAIQTTDFSNLFQEAGLDPAKWTAVEPAWTPPVYADTRAAWTGVLPGRPDYPLRIEAAAFRGRPVSWVRLGSWEVPGSTETSGSSMAENAGNAIFAGLLIALVIGGALLARRNLRTGRGDRRGATRLASYSLILSAVSWVFGEHHVGTFGELALVEMFISEALFLAGFVWLLYIALEPWVRRRWPRVLVGWSRLLAGRLRDPLVGRDLLIGCTAAATLDSLMLVQRALSSWLGIPTGQPIVGTLDVLLGPRQIIVKVADLLFAGPFSALAILFLVFLLRLLLRREWAAAALIVLLPTVAGTLQTSAGASTGSLLLSAATGAVVGGVLVFVVLRVGLLASAATVVFDNLLRSFPITTQVSAWYFGIGLTGIVLLLAMAGYAFYTSLGGQPLFGRLLTEDGK
jgi:hypothetical protein